MKSTWNSRWGPTSLRISSPGGETCGDSAPQYDGRGVGSATAETAHTTASATMRQRDILRGIPASESKSSYNVRVLRLRDDCALNVHTHSQREAESRRQFSRQAHDLDTLDQVFISTPRRKRGFNTSGSFSYGQLSSKRPGFCRPDCCEFLRARLRISRPRYARSPARTLPLAPTRHARPFPCLPCAHPSTLPLPSILPRLRASCWRGPGRGRSDQAAAQAHDQRRGQADHGPRGDHRRGPQLGSSRARPAR